MTELLRFRGSAVGDDSPLGDHHVEKGVSTVDRYCTGLNNDALTVVALILRRQNRPSGDHNPCQYRDTPFELNTLPLHVQSLNGKLQLCSFQSIPRNGIGGLGGEDFLAVGGTDGREDLAAQRELHSVHADVILGLGHKLDNLTRIDREAFGGRFERELRRLIIHIAFHDNPHLGGGLLSHEVRRQDPDPHRGIRIPKRGREVGLIGGRRIGEERLIVKEEDYIPKGHIILGLGCDADVVPAPEPGPLDGSGDGHRGRLSIGWNFKEQGAREDPAAYAVGSSPQDSDLRPRRGIHRKGQREVSPIGSL
ncbi:MAG: hypothetical protein BWY86_00333 [Candidatus Aminicenantes bacterium ADurb.Bin508]|nr:MAG: hypothetical protein BWY86_00333 [Candidatus Aminicenantes bacterium ADurb.Bin508]